MLSVQSYLEAAASHPPFSILHPNSNHTYIPSLVHNINIELADLPPDLSHPCQPYETPPILFSIRKTTRHTTQRIPHTLLYLRTTMMLFGLGNLFYGTLSPFPPSDPLPSTPKKLTSSSVSILLVNAVAVLSEDRFLARST